jgi:hypothetical protein
MSGKLHSERAHSKFSASGAERWFNCPGSVELSEGLPDKSTVWAVEGTHGHEVLETLLLKAIKHQWQGIPVIATNIEIAKLLQNPEIPRVASKLQRDVKDMVNDIVRHSRNAAEFMLKKFRENPDAEFMVETRIYLSFIHEAMFGTFDGAVVDHFGTLHVFDYKYGAGHGVSPAKNLQMIFYAIGLAFRFHWNFKRVRMWIIQPRIKGYDGPMFWEVTITELKEYVSEFERAVERVERFPKKYVEGSWCHWCKAKSICPLKMDAKLDKAKQLFSFLPVEKDAEFL